LVAFYRRFQQGYLTKTLRSSVRIRRSDALATITVKGPRDDVSRPEFEYPIPVDEAEEMLRDLCKKPLIEKVRHWVIVPGATWQVDVYGGAASGLVLAEIELDDPNQSFERPDWLGQEVTHDPYYSGSAIALRAGRGARHADPVRRPSTPAPATAPPPP
jgi:adenylate cyclase